MLSTENLKIQRVSITEILNLLFSQIAFGVIQILLKIFFYCWLIYKKIIRKVQSIRLFPSSTKQKKSEVSPVSTEAGQDANAGKVHICRYFFTYLPSEFQIDPKLRKFEEIFFTLSERVFVWICKSCRCHKFLLNVMSELGSDWLLGRTVLIDRLIKENLLREDSTEPVKKLDQQVQKRGQVQQVLILGAGYDSRAYRFGKLVKASNHDGNIDGNICRFIEVDQASVQTKKKRFLIEAFGKDTFDELAKDVDFVECNFECAGALKDALKRCSHFDPSLSTLVLWEGVTAYLSEDAIKDTLEALCTLRRESNAKPQWKLVFDFIDSSVFDSKATDLQRLLVEMTSFINSPVISGLPRNLEKLDKYLQPYDIKVLKVWNFLSMMGELFDIDKAECGLPGAVAVCEWVMMP